MAAVVVAGAVTVAACAIAAVLALTSSSSSCDEAPAPMDATVAEAASPATSRECAVCLSELPAGTEEERSPGAEPAAVRALLACGHAFHTDCIGRWLLLRPECPLCRCPVLLAGGHQAAARAAVAAPTPAPAWARPARIACGFGDGRVVWTRSPSARQ